MLTIGVVLATGTARRIQRLTVTESVVAARWVQSDRSSTAMLSGGGRLGSPENRYIQKSLPAQTGRYEKTREIPDMGGQIGGVVGKLSDSTKDMSAVSPFTTLCPRYLSGKLALVNIANRMEELWLS